MRLEKCFEEGLLKEHIFPLEVIEREMKNARHHIKNARQCVDSKMYDLAVVSIYTSMFHAARAILFKEGFKERSHVCVIA